MTMYPGNQRRSHAASQPRGSGREKFDLKPWESKIQHWVKNGIDQETISFAETFGKQLQMGDLTTSQIRNVFGEMRRIQMNDFVQNKSAFLMLKPKLAYAVKRHNKPGLEAFYRFFTCASTGVDTNEDTAGKRHYDNLMNIIEAVLAYHKYSGGKE